jgi:hypothetical protein
MSRIVAGSLQSYIERAEVLAMHCCTERYGCFVAAVEKSYAILATLTMRRTRTPKLIRCSSEHLRRSPGARSSMSDQSAARRETRLIFCYDRRAVGPGASGVVNAVGAGDRLRRRRTLMNDGGAVGPGASGTVDAVRAGHGISRLGRCQNHKGRTAKRGQGQHQSVCHQG